MRYLRLLALASALAALAPLPPPARGQDQPSPEAMAAAQELFGLLFDSAIVQLNAQAVDFAWPPIESAVRARNPNLDAATVTALRSEFERIRLGRLRRLMQDMPTIYARHLTREEMSEAIKFYRTPTGSRIMQVVPRVFTEGFGAVLPRLPQLAADTQEAFRELLRERGLLR